jgi:hypothetical protein
MNYYRSNSIISINRVLMMTNQAISFCFGISILKYASFSPGNDSLIMGSRNSVMMP